MLKAIHASEDREAARAKAAQVVAKLIEMKLPAAAALVKDFIEEIFSYYAFPSEHHRSLRTNIPLERIMPRDPAPHPRSRRLARRQIRLAPGPRPSPSHRRQDL